MAIINKTGITDGGTIQAEHVTRAIDALSGVSTDSIVATGSFTGSFKGSFTGSLNGTADNAGSINTSTNSSENQSYYITSVAASSGTQLLYTDSTLRFNPSTNALTLTGSLTTSGSLTMTATPTSNVDLSAISSSGQFAIPLVRPDNPVPGSIYFDVSGRIYVWDGSQWLAWISD